MLTIMNNDRFPVGSEQFANLDHSRLSFRSSRRSGRAVAALVILVDHLRHLLRHRVVVDLRSGRSNIVDLIIQH